MQTGSNGERFGPYSRRFTETCPPVPAHEVENVMAGVRHLASADREYFRGLVGLLQRRRVDGPDQVDLCDRGDDDPDFGVLVVRGELVCRSEAVDERFEEMIADHSPVETGAPAEFEGRIPEGEYGAGRVLLWDRGTWEPPDDAARALERGRLSFQLHGEKLSGGWALVRIRGRERRAAGKTWLLVKERDRQARPGYDVTAERPESVLGGAGRRRAPRVWHSNKPARSRAATRRTGRRRWWTSCAPSGPTWSRRRIA